MQRAYNFSSGPSCLPMAVIEEAQQSLRNWQGCGASVMEITYHEDAFRELMHTCEADLRALLHIPPEYKVLFMQGGARGQFSMVPLNLLGQKKSADYLQTGLWSEMAFAEGKRYADMRQVATGAPQHYTSIPPVSEWRCSEDAAYFHYVDNETVHGNEMPSIVGVQSAPLVCDMSSNLLTRVFDIQKFALIYAAAQKTLGISGITLVVIKADLLGKAHPMTPMICNYTRHAHPKGLLLQTPPTFAWYITSLVLAWAKKQGGVAALEDACGQKSQKLYRYLDASSLYYNRVDPKYRSRINVVFRLQDHTLMPLFLEKAKQAGFLGLKGHAASGGIRASLYPALSPSAVDALIDFLKDFEKRA